jgi:hypothetical protein
VAATLLATTPPAAASRTLKAAPPEDQKPCVKDCGGATGDFVKVEYAGAFRTLMTTQGPTSVLDGAPGAPTAGPVPKWGGARAPEKGTTAQKQALKVAADSAPVGEDDSSVDVDGSGEIRVPGPASRGSSDGWDTPTGPGNTPPSSPIDTTRLYDSPQWNGGVLSWCWGWGKECGEAAAAKFCQAKGHKGVASIGGQVAMPKGSSVVVPEGGFLGPKCTSGMLLTCHTFASITCRE